MPKPENGKPGPGRGLFVPPQRVRTYPTSRISPLRPRFPSSTVYYYLKTRGRTGQVGCRASAWIQPGARGARNGKHCRSPRKPLLAFVKSWEARTANHRAWLSGGRFMPGGQQAGRTHRERRASVFREFPGMAERPVQGHGDSLPEGARQTRRDIRRHRTGILGPPLDTFKDPEYIRLEIARLKKCLGDICPPQGRKAS